MREARQNTGLTQKQASELSGLRQATISKIENDPASCILHYRNLVTPNKSLSIRTSFTADAG
ncbi:helix-turn-helix transcriptional regulator [Vibrio diabolicus]|nr:helix-turn-helix transcriptional regulator [Vibrio diabolicus]